MFTLLETGPAPASCRGAPRGGASGALRMTMLLWSCTTLMGSAWAFAPAWATSVAPGWPALALIGGLAAIWAGSLVHGRPAILLVSIPGFFGAGLLLDGRTSVAATALGLGFVGCQVWNLLALWWARTPRDREACR